MTGKGVKIGVGHVTKNPGDKVSPPSWFTKWAREYSEWKKELKEELKSFNELLRQKFSDVSEKVVKHEKKLIDIVDSLSSVDQKQREKNIVIHGLEFSDPVYNDIPLDVQCSTWFQQKLKIAPKIEAAFRLGNGCQAPLLVKLSSVMEKKKIFLSHVLIKLKGSGVSIQDDLPADVRKGRKEWMHTLKILKQKGNRVRFKGGKLYCGGTLVTKKLSPSSTTVAQQKKNAVKKLASVDSKNLPSKLTTTVKQKKNSVPEVPTIEDVDDYEEDDYEEGDYEDEDYVVDEDEEYEDDHN